MNHNESKKLIIINEFIIQCTTLSDSFFHFKNEGRTSYIGGKQFKRMGVKSGVYDLFISKPTSVYHGCWWEVKDIGCKRSAAQVFFAKNREDEGYYTAWSDDENKIIADIKRLYALYCK